MESTSKLNAVNSMLMAAGESPVSTLEGNTGLHVVQATHVLDETIRRVLGDGWTFNQTSKTFSLDSDNKLPVNNDIISIDDPNNQSRDPVYTIRSGYIYDMLNDTDIFSGNLTLDAIVFLDWEDLPQHAKDYILAKAIRIYTDRTVGSSELGQMTRHDEQETYARFRRIELKNGDYRVLDDETYRRIVLRRI